MSSATPDQGHTRHATICCSRDNGNSIYPDGRCRNRCRISGTSRHRIAHIHANAGGNGRASQTLPARQDVERLLRSGICCERECIQHIRRRDTQRTLCRDGYRRHAPHHRNDQQLFHPALNSPSVSYASFTNTASAASCFCLRHGELHLRCQSTRS
jgi:hypothetical protein